MRVEVFAPFDWRVPGKRSWQHYKPGAYTVKRECGEAIVRAGCGREIKPPRKEDAGK